MPDGNDGKSIRVGSDLLGAQKQILPDGVVGQQMKNGPNPGADLLAAQTPDAVLELLKRKGAVNLWNEFKTEIANSPGGSHGGGWRGVPPPGANFGDEWKVVSIVQGFKSRFAELGLEPYFCSKNAATSSCISP